MTACKSQGYTGVLLLCNNLRSKAVTSSDVLWRLQAILIDNILIFGRRQHDFLSPANRCWFRLFQRVWSDPTTGPVSVPFLSVSLICISPHIEGRKKRNFSERLNALFGEWVSLIRMQYPGDMSGNPPLLSAQLQPTVKVFRLFGLPLIDYSYMCTVSEHTTAFSITGPAASRFFFFS